MLRQEKVDPNFKLGPFEPVIPSNASQPLTHDDQFINERVCDEVAGGEELEVRLGFSMSCKSKILYLHRGQDFEMLEWEAFERKFETADINTSSKWVEKENTKIEETGKLPIQLKGSSKLEEFLLAIDISDSNNDKNGEQLLQVSNGNLHLVVRKYYNKGTPQEYVIEMAMIQLYANNWPNVMTGDVTAESSFDWELRNQRMPIYRTLGVAPAGWALPKEDELGKPITPPTLEATTVSVTADKVTLSGLTLTDPSDITEQKALVRAYDETGKLQGESVVAMPTSADVEIAGTFTNGAYVQLAYLLLEAESATYNLWIDAQNKKYEISKNMLRAEKKQ